ncbi:MAG: glycosyltransferase family 9 protein [Candidatus Aminicenantes bacterium]|nr:MAG: glycosyltransferase family 9 protein [Candidatus Aminicenantes bacterium]
MRSVVFLQKRDFFGNRLIHLPLLYELKHAFTENELVVFSPFESSYFFKDIGLADEVNVYSYGFLRMLRWLRSLKPDLIISLRPRSSWLNLAIGLSGAKERLGFKTAISRVLFSGTVKRNTSVYRPLDFLKLLEPIGIYASPEKFFREKVKKGIIKLQQNRECFCLMPGGGTGEFKRWGIGNFLGFCQRIKENQRNATFTFILGEAEKDYIEQIQSSSVAKDSLILFNESVPSIAQVVAACKVTIANDCGPSHIAQMMKVPYVGIFSNHDGNAHERIAEWFFEHEKAVAVTSEPLKDMKSIPVEQIEKAVSQVLS